MRSFTHCGDSNTFLEFVHGFEAKSPLASTETTVPLLGKKYFAELLHGHCCSLTIPLYELQRCFGFVSSSPCSSFQSREHDRLRDGSLRIDWTDLTNDTKASDSESSLLSAEAAQSVAEAEEGERNFDSVRV